jgi:hypothetical protein
MAGTLHKLEFTGGMPDFWSFSDDELAATCVRIAEGRFPNTRPFLRAEAMRLYLLWRDALNTAHQAQHYEGKKACILAGLRKRTIQILVKLSLPSSATVAP